MRSTLFRRLWQFNAVVFALVGALSLFALTMTILSNWDRIWGRDPADENVRQLPTDNTANSAAAKLQFGSYTSVPGKSLLMIAVGENLSSGERPEAYGFEEGYDPNVVRVRNLIVADLATQTQRHVLPDNKRLIVKWELLGDRADSRIVKGRAFFALVSAKDGKADSGKFDALVGNLETGKQVWVAHNVDAIDVANNQSSGNLGFIVSRGNAVELMQIGLADMKATTVKVSTEPQ